MFPQSVRAQFSALQNNCRASGQNVWPYKAQEGGNMSIQHESSVVLVLNDSFAGDLSDANCHKRYQQQPLSRPLCLSAI
jgi:hypothetical protein